LKFRGELYALCFSTRQFGGRLPEPDIAQADLAQYAKRSAERLVIRKKIERIVYSHRQHVRDRFVADLDLQRLGVVASTLAGWTGRVHARQKKQFDANEAFALTGLTAPVGDVEGES